MSVGRAKSVGAPTDIGRVREISALEQRYNIKSDGKARHFARPTRGNWMRSISDSRRRSTCVFSLATRSYSYSALVNPRRSALPVPVSRTQHAILRRLWKVAGHYTPLSSVSRSSEEHGCRFTFSCGTCSVMNQT